MVSVVVAILGLAAATAFVWVMWSRTRRLKELARKNCDITSQQELEDFIRRVDQVTADDELDHLDGKGDD